MCNFIKIFEYAVPFYFDYTRGKMSKFNIIDSKFS